MTFLRKLAAAPILTLAAICFGAFVVVADRCLFGSMLNRPPDFSDLDVLVINGLLVSAPFVWLAYRGSRRLLPWITGMVLTLWLWWRFLGEGVAYQRAPDGSGVDMAFALLILVSPAFVGAVCVWIDEIMRRRSQRSG